LDLAQVDAGAAGAVVRQLRRARDAVEVEQLQQVGQLDPLVELFQLLLELSVFQLAIGLEVLRQRVQLAHPLRDDGLDRFGEGVLLEQRLDQAVGGQGAEQGVVEGAAGWVGHGRSRWGGLPSDYGGGPPKDRRTRRTTGWPSSRPTNSTSRRFAGEPTFPS